MRSLICCATLALLLAFAGCEKTIKEVRSPDSGATLAAR